MKSFKGTFDWYLELDLEIEIHSYVPDAAPTLDDDGTGDCDFSVYLVQGNEKLDITDFLTLKQIEAVENKIENHCFERNQ